MNESAITAKLRAALVDLGAVAWKVSDRFHASRPDLYIAYQGECSFIEMKIWPFEPTPLQADTLNELSAVGIITYLGKYDKALKTLVIRNWVTGELYYFPNFKEAALWLLKPNF